MKRKKLIAKDSVIDMIDLVMVQAGISRDQVLAAYDTFVHFILRRSRKSNEK